MRIAKDTTLRYLAMLQLLPVYPNSKSTSQIRNELSSEDNEYKVDIRTTQRDLEKLSSVFPISCDLDGRINYWYWTDRNALTQIPAMGQSTALAFQLASDYLKPIMPTSTLRLLGPYFQHANNILSKTKLGKWPSKVRIIDRGPELIPPKIDEEVQKVVYQALLEEKQLDVDYQSRGKDKSKSYTLNPLGIVFRNGIIYLVATLWDYSEPMHFALHRMSNPKLSLDATKRVPGFKLETHIKEDKEFSYPIENKKIKLHILVNSEIAIHLSEVKLSYDQKIKMQSDGKTLVTATLTDTQELRWWLLGFGDQVEIKSPKSLRKDIAVILRKTLSSYSDC